MNENILTFFERYVCAFRKHTSNKSLYNLNAHLLIDQLIFLEEEIAHLDGKSPVDLARQILLEDEKQEIEDTLQLLNIMIRNQ
jgi:hypothetical protein